MNLKRRKDSHDLKCLQCGWKWTSRRQYAAKLPDWKEEKRSGMTYRDVLVRLRRGDLRVNPITSVVETKRSNDVRGKTRLARWRRLKQYEDQHGSGYRFVEICYKGRKRKVGVHVLQWMQKFGRVVPRGHDVHHKTSPPRPQKKDNGIANIELRDSRENQRDNGSGGHDDEF